MKHALRNALLPVVTNIGARNCRSSSAGAIVTETIFSWQGMGLLFITGRKRTETTSVLMGLILITSTLVVFFNLVADVVYAVVDPRIRYD